MVKPFSSDIGDLKYWTQSAKSSSVYKHASVRHLTHLSLANVGASSIAISADLTKTGVLLNKTPQRCRCEAKVKTYRHPGLLRILTTCLTVSSITFGGVMSIWFETSLNNTSSNALESPWLCRRQRGWSKQERQRGAPWTFQ